MLTNKNTLNGVDMAEKISREAIKREEGYLYYLGKDGYVWQNPTRSNKSGRKAKVGNEKNRKREGLPLLRGQQRLCVKGKAGTRKEGCKIIT